VEAAKKNTLPARPGLIFPGRKSTGEGQSGNQEEGGMVYKRSAKRIRRKALFSASGENSITFQNPSSSDY